MHVRRRFAPLGPLVGLLVVLPLAGCGGEAPREAARPAPAQETVFDDMVEKKTEIPAAVEAAQDARVEGTRAAIEAAEGRGEPER